jgi:hypothetical protein
MTPSVDPPTAATEYCSQEYYPGFKLVWTQQPCAVVREALLSGKTVIIPLGWRRK